MPTALDHYVTTPNKIYLEVKRRGVPIYFYSIRKSHPFGARMEVMKHVMDLKGNITPYPPRSYTHWLTEERLYLNYWVAWAAAMRINNGQEIP